MEEARHAKSKDYFMASRVKRHMVELVVDMAMTRASREDDEPHAVVNVDYLSGYGCGVAQGGMCKKKNLRSLLSV